MCIRDSPCTVVDPVWSLPVSADLVDLCRDYEHVVTVEDSLVVGGLGARLALALQDASVPTTIQNVGIPASFLDHASRDELIDSLGLSAQAIARQLVERAAAADDASTAARSGVRNHLD